MLASLVDSISRSARRTVSFTLICLFILCFLIGDAVEYVTPHARTYNFCCCCAPSLTVRSPLSLVLGGSCCCPPLLPLDFVAGRSPGSLRCNFFSPVSCILYSFSYILYPVSLCFALGHPCFCEFLLPFLVRPLLPAVIAPVSSCYSPSPGWRV